MTGNDGKGRRAAERRRARDAKPPRDAAEGFTTPGAVPIDPEDIDEESVSDVEPPLVSDVREVERERSRPTGGTEPARRKPDLRAQPENDPEASFVRAVRQSRDDREGSVEQTALRDAPHKRERKGGKLLILEGADPGKELPIKLTPSLVGRGEGAELRIDDPTVSLRHLEIKIGSGGATLYDVGSTSGTLLNGVVVDGEVPLVHGDVIALGKTELRYLRADGAPADRPEPEPPKEPTLLDPTIPLPKERTKTRQLPQRTQLELALERKKQVRTTAVRVIGACVLVLVLAVTARVLQKSVFSDRSAAQVRAQVAQLLAEGNRRLLAQDVEGALATADTILALDPGNGDADSLQKMARTEGDARNALELALRLGDEERDVEAEQILKRIPDASAFAKDRDRLRRTLGERGQIRSRRAIEALLDRGESKAAMEAAEQHVAQFPGDADGKELLERARAAFASAPRNPALTRARQQFSQGDVEGARATALQGGYRAYVADLDRFAQALEKGRTALRQSQDGAAALPSLDEAYRLLPGLGGSAQSPILAETAKPYGNALYLIGTEKLEKGDRCGAARDLFRAARVLPDDPKLQAKLRQLDDIAEQGLVRARAARVQDPDRAAALAREALCVARSGTATQDDLKQLARF